MSQINKAFLQDLLLPGNSVLRRRYLIKKNINFLWEEDQISASQWITLRHMVESEDLENLALVESIIQTLSGEVPEDVKLNK